MKKILNNKGFTLIELLAVLVILTAIMTIAIPNISSSLERSKDKQDKSKQKLLITAAELYVSDNRNVIYRNLGTDTECYIALDTLVRNNLLSNDSLEKSSGDKFTGVIVFNKENNSYDFVSSTSVKQC